jgi:hypothetical protein
MKKTVKKDIPSKFDMKTGVDVGKGAKMIPKMPIKSMPIKGMPIIPVKTMLKAIKAMSKKKK